MGARQAGIPRPGTRSPFRQAAGKAHTFISPATAFFHDVSFIPPRSRRRRKILYALAAPSTVIGYLMHRPSARHRDGFCLAQMTGHRTPQVIALFRMGDVIEEFLDPIGLELEDFVERMTGGWLFGSCRGAELGRPQADHRLRV